MLCYSKFVEDSYLAIKAQHPELPVLVRPGPSIAPRVVLRMDNGKEMSLAGAASAEQIATDIEAALKK